MLLPELDALKCAIITAAFEHSYPYVIVDTAVEGVEVPPHILASGEPLNLQLRFANGPQNPGMKFTAEGIEGTFSFSRQPFYVRIPWTAIVRMDFVVVEGALAVIQATLNQPQPQTPPPKKKVKLRSV